MSDRMDFEIVCPNDHEQTVTFSGEEFEAANPMTLNVGHHGLGDIGVVRID